MVFMGESLLTQNVPRKVCGTPISRRCGCLPILAAPLTASETSRMLEMPISASLRLTIGRLMASPAVGCTSTFMPAFSFSTLAIADAVV